MGQQYSELSERHIDFIRKQKIYFVGTATKDSKVNISPRGMTSFQILDQKTIAWLNVTGSGNETAAHIQNHQGLDTANAAADCGVLCKKGKYE